MQARIWDPRDSGPDRFDTSEPTEYFDLDDTDFESRGLTTDSYVHRHESSWSQAVLRRLPLRWRRLLIPGSRRRNGRKILSGQYGHTRSFGRRVKFLIKLLLALIVILMSFTGIFWPSYNNPPAHYGALRRRILTSDAEGRANADDQQIFIAASIYDRDGHLVDGAWGQNVLELIDLLGSRNVYLSIYENGGPEAEAALNRLGEKVRCNSSLVYEENLSTDNVGHVTLQDGSRRVKRIAYLAEARNLALQPLEKSSDVTYDKVLFLNDILFDPINAAQLLFSTNADENGKASFKAVCAVDFINPFKFYDTFATRDLEGYSMGVPFFPWYSNAGQGLSRQDVLDGKDAVRVKSCWGGMAAFDAHFLQAQRAPSDGGSVPTSDQSRPRPVRFRAVPDPDWDASECCLIHADVLGASSDTMGPDDTGIYQNPYVRVAYGSRTLWWLPITRRIERLYTIPHAFVNRLVGLPWYNPRRVEKGGDSTEESINGSASTSKAGTAGWGADGYCGVRTLQLLRKPILEGEKSWETIALPSA